MVVWVKRVVIVTYHLRPAGKEENVLVHIPMPRPFPGNGPKEPELGDCPTKGRKLYPSETQKEFCFLRFQLVISGAKLLPAVAF